MGCTSSLPEGSPEERQRDRQVAIELKEYKKQYESKVKLLLLGAGESGKSTIFKQMRIIHASGFLPDECLKYRDIIYANTLHSIKQLVLAMQTMTLPFEREENRRRAERIVALTDEQILEHPSTVFTREMASYIDSLWKDAGIRACFARRSEFQLNDSASYFFDNIQRLAQPNFLPIQQDVLRSRVKTTGITEEEMSMEGRSISVVDVGGQRNERRKWIHCFSDVTAIIFVTSLSEYDQVLEEDGSTNRMTESLTLFTEICNNPVFETTPIILFLNKTDLFQEKINRTDLNVCFADYTGGKNFDVAATFVKDKFVSCNKHPEKKKVYPRYTCATDTEIMREVFAAVQDIFLRKNIDLAFG